MSKEIGVYKELRMFVDRRDVIKASVFANKKSIRKQPLKRLLLSKNSCFFR